MKEKTRKVVTGVCALALTAAVSIAGTLAYLSKVTEQRANNFTFSSKAVNAMLTEPYWDAVIDYHYEKEGTTYKIYPIYDYLTTAEDGDNTVDETPVYGYVDGNIKKPILYTPNVLKEKRKAGAFTGEYAYLNDLFKESTEWGGDEPEWKDGLDPWTQLYKQPKEYPDDRAESFGETGDSLENTDKAHYYEYYGYDDLDTDSKFDPDRPGRLAAQNMVPGQVANKNPLITNIGEHDEWVAAKIWFVYSETAGNDYAGQPKAGRILSDADYQTLMNVIEIDWSTNVIGDSAVTGSSGAYAMPEDKWYLASYPSYNPSGADKDALLAANTKLPEDKSMTFYYTSPLEGSTSVAAKNSGNITLSKLDATKPIFTKVTVKKTATPEQIEALDAIGGFAIYIEGYAVQYETHDSYTDGQDRTENDKVNAYGWVNSNGATFPTDKTTFTYDQSVEYKNRSDQAVGPYASNGQKTVDQPGIHPSPAGRGDKLEPTAEPVPAEQQD